MSIINVKNGKDVITLDFRMSQIRYCKNIAQHGKIHFIDYSEFDMACFKILHDDNKESFLSALAEDMQDRTGKKIDPTKLQIITTQQYLEVFA